MSLLIFSHYLAGNPRVPWSRTVGCCQSGATSDEVRALVEAAPVGIAPPNVIVMVGTNDILRVSVEKLLVCGLNFKLFPHS